MCLRPGMDGEVPVPRKQCRSGAGQGQCEESLSAGVHMSLDLVHDVTHGREPEHRACRIARQLELLQERSIGGCEGPSRGIDASRGVEGGRCREIALRHSSPSLVRHAEMLGGTVPRANLYVASFVDM